MADSAADQLRQVFSSPLLDEEGRRIVFWHDVEGSFAQEFEQLRQEGIGGAGGRKVLFADAAKTTSSSTRALPGTSRKAGWRETGLPI